MTTCTHCGKYFVPKYASLKLCFDCFKKRDKALAEYDDLIEEVRRLQGHLDRAFSDIRALQDERDRATVIPPEKLKALVQLCHPDRHGNSQAANDATVWLLAQRKRA
jgi:hypothetical protein